MQRGIGGTHAIVAMVNHVLDDYEVRGKEDLASELVEIIRRMTEVADERGYRAGLATRVPPAHEEVAEVIRENLRHEYGWQDSIQAKHERVIKRVMDHIWPLIAPGHYNR